jgi:hypothetical protein
VAASREQASAASGDNLLVLHFENVGKVDIIVFSYN